MPGFDVSHKEMVLRRIVNGAMLGGWAAYGLSSHVARQEWRQKMMDDPHFHQSINGDWGQPQQSWWNLYGAPSVGDWPLTLQDMDKWDAMGRNYTHSQGAMGAALGAVTGAAVGLATRQREPSPQPMPRAGHWQTRDGAGRDAYVQFGAPAPAA